MSTNQWNYYHPIFECDRENPEVLIYSPWVGHRRFAYDYVRCIKPSLIVELGSYYGCSAFAILQAVKDGGLDSSFYAVDTWMGDSFTKTDYREDIYGAYKAINNQCFGQVHSIMLRATFDEAVSRFQDGSIDLLHIDGSHTYEDVKHDYTLWRSKVSSDGVIFFHDVGKDLLFGEPMGSHIFWEELKQDHPYTLEFPFSNGLGILFQSRDAYQQACNMIDMSVYQSYINLQDTIHKDELRKKYFRIRDQKTHISDLERQIGVLNYHLEQYRQDTASSAAYIGQLEETQQALREQLVSETQDNVQQLQQLRAFAQSKEDHAQALMRDMAQLSAFTKEKENYIQELESQMAALRTFAQSKEIYAEALMRDMAQLSAFTKEKENYIQELEGHVAGLKDFAQGKETYAIQLEQRLADATARMEALQTDLTVLTREKENLEKRNSKLIRRVQKLPFGGKLLKDLM